jgi:MFS family permease
MRATLVLLFLTLLNILNFADRYLLQSFSVDVMRDLELSNLQFTLLTGFVFTVFYTLAGLLMGAAADRYHRPRLMACGLFLWSALTMVTGNTKNFMQMAATRVFIGVGEATLTPAAIGMLGDVMSPRLRAFAAGFYYLGVPIGIGGSYLIAASLGRELGWRNCFFILGAVGMFLCLILLLLRDPRSAAHQAATANGENSIASAFPEFKRCLLGSPALGLAIIGGVSVTFAQGALVLDQVWMVQERAFTTVGAQQLSGTMFLLGGVLGTLLGGVGSDMLESRCKGGRLYFLAFIYLLATPLTLVFRFADPEGVMFHIAMFVGCASMTMVFGPLAAAVQDLVPERIRSTTIAFMVLCLALFGVAPGNLIVGLLADMLTAAGLAEPYTWAATLASAPGLLAVPCFYFAARRFARSQADVEGELVMTSSAPLKASA